MPAIAIPFDPDLFEIGSFRLPGTRCLLSWASWRASGSRAASVAERRSRTTRSPRWRSGELGAALWWLVFCS